MAIHLPSVTPAKAGVHHDAAPRVQRWWRALDSGRSLPSGAKRPVGRNDTVLPAKCGETP